MKTSLAVGAVLGLAQAVLAQDGATAGAETTTQVGSVWDFVVKGGPMMIPIGLCSFVAMTIAIERLVSLRRKQVIPPVFLGELNDHLDNGGEGYAKALSYCEKDGSPIAVVFAAALKRMGQGVETIEKHIAHAGEGVVFKLRKNLRALAVIASIAPLLGLLGTIFGMIDAFQTVAMSGEALGKTELLAKGIYQAMITTAAGLMLAIPALIAYYFFSAKIDHLVRELDVVTVEFVEAHAHRADADEPAGPKLQALESEAVGTVEAAEATTAAASA